MTQINISIQYAFLGLICDGKDTAHTEDLTKIYDSLAKHILY